MSCVAELKPLFAGLLVDELMNAQLETHAHSSINAVPKAAGEGGSKQTQI